MKVHEECAADVEDELLLQFVLSSSDGCRSAPYVDTHCHLECVLQCIRHRQVAPSCSKRWQDMTSEERRLWRILGWSRSQWHGELREENPICFRDWSALSSAEQAAAEALGWDTDKWAGWWWLLPSDVDWQDFNESVRTHLTTLGETADSWSDMLDAKNLMGAGDGGDNRTWDELMPEEREAARALGHSNLTWDLLELADLDSYVDNFCGGGFEACVTQGCDECSLPDAVKLAMAHPKVFAAFGCHPKIAWLYDDALERGFLEAFTTCGRKAVAWGEVGLDYSLPYWGWHPDYRKEQQDVFERQLDLAMERGLPLVLHIRNGDGDYAAEEEALEILRRKVPKDWKAHVHGNHCASLVGSLLSEFSNFFFGLTGTVTMGGVGEGTGTEMCGLVPLKKLLIETDAPFIKPRGTCVNHIGQVPLIARAIAEMRGWDVNEVLKTARANSRFIYGI